MDLNPAVLLAEPAGFAAGIAILRLPSRIRRGRRNVILNVAAAISAGAALTAGCAPTGWVVLDALLLAVLGAAGVFAGANAPSPLLLAASVVGAVAGLGSIALPVALAAFGLALVSVLLRTDRVVNAVAGALVVQAVLRLTHPETRGMTALVAAVVLISLFGAAAQRLKAKHRRLLGRVALGAGAFGVIGAIGGAVAAAGSVGPLREGLSVATETINATQSVDLETTASGLREAGRDFTAARRALEAWWALPARAVPVVAQHWRVLRAAALTGDELTQAGQRAADAPILGDIRISEGRLPLEQLAAMEAPVSDVASRTKAARERLHAARSAWLVPPLEERLNTQLRRVTDIDATAQLARRVVQVVPGLLGRDGPRRYFLAVQTPVEARASGGFMGNFGEITAEDGRVNLSRFGRQTELTEAPGALNRKLEAPEDFLSRYSRFQPNLEWANVNLSPDFPTTAKVIASLYPQSGGVPVDGVIAVDPSALAAVLALAGPVQVPAWPEPITAANAEQVLLHDQYQLYTNATEFERVDFLGTVAQEAWRRLTGGDLPPVPEMIATLGPAVREKHLFLASIRPEEQALFEEMKAAGRMAPVQGDFMGLVTQNASGNKIDYFMRREVDYRVQLDPDSGRVDARVTVMLHNEAPASGISPSFIANEVEPPIPIGSNRLYLSFYTPWQLVKSSVDGVDKGFERESELGRRVYSTALVIPPRSTAVVELRLSGQLPEGDRYHLDVHRQPMVAPDGVTATLALDPGWVTASGAREQTLSWQLASDVAADVRLVRAG